MQSTLVKIGIAAVALFVAAAFIVMLIPGTNEPPAATVTSISKTPAEEKGTAAYRPRPSEYDGPSFDWSVFFGGSRAFSLSNKSESGNASSVKPKFPLPSPDCPDRLFYEALNLMVKWDSNNSTLLSIIQNIIDNGWNGDYPGLEKLLAANAETFKKLEQGIDDPDCWFRPPEQLTFDCKLGHLIGCSHLARLYLLKIRFLQKNGDAEAAAAGFTRGLRFAQDFERTGILLSDLVGQGIENSYLKIIAKEFNKPEPDFAFCSRIENAMYELESRRVPLLKSIETEKQALLNEMDKLKNMKDEKLLKYARDLGLWLQNASDVEETKRDLEKLRDRTVQVCKFIDEQYGELEAAGDSDVYALLMKAKETTRNMEQEIKRDKSLKCIMGAFDTEGFLSARARGRVNRDLVRTGLALELYRENTGAYPGSLSELVPKYLRRVPVDPFSGKPVKYSKTGSGWKVYSYGPDFKDDDGKGNDKTRRDSDIIYERK